MGMKLTTKYAERVKGIGGDILSKLILNSLRELMTKASENKPLVIISDDMHWSYLSTIEMLESLFGLVEKNRILFINVFRPGYEETSARIEKLIKKSMPSTM